MRKFTEFNAYFSILDNTLSVAPRCHSFRPHSRDPPPREVEPRSRPPRVDSLVLTFPRSPRPRQCTALGAPPPRGQGAKKLHLRPSSDALTGPLGPRRRDAVDTQSLYAGRDLHINTSRGPRGPIGENFVHIAPRCHSFRPHSRDPPRTRTSGAAPASTLWSSPSRGAQPRHCANLGTPCSRGQGAKTCTYAPLPTPLSDL